MNEFVDVKCNPNQKKYCAINLGGVRCDGYNKDGRVGVFSHFHEDHIRSITECIGEYDTLITHPITFKGIVALKPGIRYREQWMPQDFDTKFKTSFGVVRLLKANHIPGSAQVHVETDGKSLLYSGDFSFPDMQIKKADYLVLDATHGDPSFDGKTDRYSVMNRLFDDVQEKSLSNKSVVIQTSGGTLQEIVRNFEIKHHDKIPENVAFVMDERQKNVLFSIYEDDTRELRENIILYDSPEFWHRVRNGKPCVVFVTSTILDDDLKKFYHIIIDQYRFSNEKPAIFEFSEEYGAGCRYNLASHASIENIYSYVEAVNPKYVVTDNSRSDFAPKLAKLVQQKFPNIRATHKPNKP